MFSFDKSDLQRVAVSAVGALAITAGSFFAVASPANAARFVPRTVGEWQAQVEKQIDSTADTASVRMPVGEPVEAVLALRFTADGDFAGATIARSSGKAALDAHAVNVAAHVSYPRLPASYRGTPRTVAMRLVFGRANDAAQAEEMRAKSRAAIQIARADRADITIAAK